MLSLGLAWVLAKYYGRDYQYGLGSRSIASELHNYFSYCAGFRRAVFLLDFEMGLLPRDPGLLETLTFLMAFLGWRGFLDCGAFNLSRHSHKCLLGSFVVRSLSRLVGGGDFCFVLRFGGVWFGENECKVTCIISRSMSGDNGVILYFLVLQLGKVHAMNKNGKCFQPYRTH